MSKRVGKHSASANDFLEPKPPIVGDPVNVGTGRAYGNGAVTLSWTLPAGSPEATSYSVTSSPATTTQTSASPSITFTGLAGGTSYKFTVVAINNAGSSAGTESTNAATVTTKPQAPSAPVATAGVNQDTVTWSAPANTGGSAITGYILKSSDGPTYPYGPSINSAVIAETANTSQTYTVLAQNANGDSDYSAASNSVTTVAPFFPFFPPFFPYFPPYFPFFPPFFPFFPFFPPFFPYFPPYFPFFPPYFPFFPPAFPTFSYSSIRFKNRIIKINSI